VPVVGLIGGIGSGKSTVAADFAARGACVVNADELGHRELARPTVIRRLLARFGPEIRAADSLGTPDSIDRAALGRIVFADPQALHALEAIVHPGIRRRAETIIRRVCRTREAPLIILDAPLLLEAHWDELCDQILFVDASPATRHHRLNSRRGWSNETIHAREQAQIPVDQKRAAADHAISNEGSLADLAAQIEPLWQAWTTPARTHRTPARKSPPHHKNATDPSTPND
jgi:dephospho-CoA kinase